MKPDDLPACINLAIDLQKVPGRLPEAIAEYEAALRVKPDSAFVHNNLGAALAKLPARLPEAIAQFEGALLEAMDEYQFAAAPPLVFGINHLVRRNCPI